MKSIFCFFIGLSFVTAQAAELKELKINVSTDVTVVEVEAACVSYYNDEGESDGTGLFFSTKSFQEVDTLAKKGFTSKKLLGKEVCSAQEKITTLTQVFMGTYASAKETNAAILKNGGYKLVKVAFYNEVELENKIQQEKQNAFDAL